MSSGAFHAAWAQAFPTVAAVMAEVYPSIPAIEVEAGYRPRPKVAPVPQPKEQK
jgi:hypothetical protein